MAFTEVIKREVRKKSAYSCCICQDPAVSAEVHHIIPQEEDGPNDLDNAALLCPNHHADLGANPEKRARIKETRDWWYGIVERMYSPQDLAMLGKISSDVANIKDSLPELKANLMKFIGSKIKNITPDTARGAVSGFVSSASVLSAVGMLSQAEHTKHCTNCGKEFRYLENNPISTVAALDMFPIEMNKTVYCSYCGAANPT